MRLNTNYWLAIGAVVLSVLWLGSGLIFDFGGEEAEEREDAAPLQVVVETLDYQPIPGGVSISGRTEANYVATAQARTNGVVIDLPVREGETVTRGQTIAHLSDEARGEAVREAQARLEQSRAAYEASAALAEQGFYPRLQLEERRAEQAAAAAALDRARAEAARGVIEAPVAGVVDRLLVDPGEAVSQGTEVASIVDLDPIIAVAAISDAERPLARVGETALVRLQDGREREGVVRFVASSADAATATYRLEVEIDNPEVAVTAGQIADILLAATGARAARVVRSAVTLDDSGVIGVKYVGNDGRVEFAPVQIIQDDPQGIWISGPPEGARVIVRGQEFANTGAQVAPVEAAQAPAAGRTANP
jgi:multidrug efflux system membrane fusion protein